MRRALISVLLAVFMVAVCTLAVLQTWHYQSSQATTGDDTTSRSLTAIEQGAGMTVQEALEMCEEGVDAHEWWAAHPELCIDNVTGNAAHNLAWVSKYERLKRLVELLAEKKSEGGKDNDS